MAAVLTVMRELHEMLVHLVEVARRSPDPAADVVRAEIEGLTGADPETLLLADVDALHERVGRLLSEASERVRRPWPAAQDRTRADLAGRRLAGDHRGWSFRGALLIAADLRGADLREVDLLGRPARYRRTRLRPLYRPLPHPAPGQRRHRRPDDHPSGGFVAASTLGVLNGRNTSPEGRAVPRMTVPEHPAPRWHVHPQLGFGVFQIDPADTAEAVTQALEVGYRHIDTAEMYGNEKEVGEALRSSAIARDEVYVTSKLNNGFHRPDDAERAFEKTLGDLGLDRIDLFLIHWPLPTRYDGDFVSTWRTMASFVEDGRAASVGVSNFQPAHLQRVVDETGVVPVINQVEVHPYFTNDDVRAANAKHGIATEAWSPIAKGQVLDDSVIAEIAEAKGRSTAQVTLRWHVERGDIVFPKSVNPGRMKENFELFDFSLTDDEVARIRSRPRRGGSHRPEPRHVRLDPRLTPPAGLSRGPTPPGVGPPSCAPPDRRPES